ncbi:uncharacterized protein YukE [Psychromicrobium silvestre]|uniref:Uncharacterized protein YukE n=1 Tax=Psychromicrobium silvestre TaxID=1645614 RepID=A0A7Y9LQU9_9MICC|nr:uncharacterized protein YukE [Psychromicrobium silvestre]
MAVLQVQYQAFHAASAALSLVSHEVDAAGPAVTGDVGHALLREASETFTKVWDQDGPKLADAITSDSQQTHDTAAQFAQVDAMLSGQVKGK